MAIKNIIWNVSKYALRYYDIISRVEISRYFNQEEDLINYINSHPEINKFAWWIEKEVYPEIEED